MSHKHWIVVSFLKYAARSEIAGAWHVIGLTRLLAPGLSCSGPRSFHQRPLGFETKCHSLKETFVATQIC